MWEGFPYIFYGVEEIYVHWIGEIHIEIKKKKYPECWWDDEFTVAHFLYIQWKKLK